MTRTCVNRTSAALLALPLLATAACGKTTANNPTASLAPKQALAAAFSTLGRAHALRTSFHLEVTDKAIQALEKADPSADKTAATKAQREAITSGRIELFTRVADGQTLASSLATSLRTPVPSTPPAGSQFSMSLAIGSKTLTELREVGSGFYAMADVDAFAGLANNPVSARAKIAALRARSAMPAAINTLARAALDGKWLGIDGGDLSRLQSIASGAMGGQQAAVIGGFAKLVPDLTTALAGDVVVTRTSSTGGDDHLSLGIPLQTSLRDLLQAFKRDLPAVMTKGIPSQLPSVPARTIQLAVTVHDGQISRISFDVASVMPTKIAAALGTEKFLIDLDLSTADASLTAPKDVTKVDLFSLIGELGALSQHRSSTSVLSGTNSQVFQGGRPPVVSPPAVAVRPTTHP